jgi:hypothetical protein
MATVPEETILSGLNELTIVPSKGKNGFKNEFNHGFKHLAFLCSLHCARTLDTGFTHRPLDSRGTNTLQLEIIPEEDEENPDLAPSEAIDVPDEEDQTTIIHLSRVYQSISMMVLTFSGISANFSHLLIHLIESNLFDFADVMFFLKEVAIFTELMVKFEGFDGFSEMWQIFQDLSIQQVCTLEIFMETDDFQRANDLLWQLLIVTAEQKFLLKTYVEKTTEYRVLMQELSKSWRTMLDIQNGFIMKLIERHQSSKAEQTSALPNCVEC